MAGKDKKVNVWEDAIEKRNKEAETLREASEFFAEIEKEEKFKKQTDEVSEKVEPTVIEKEVEKIKLVDKNVVRYTSKRPFKNTAKRDSINSHDDVLFFDGEENSKKSRWTLFGVVFSAILIACILIPLVFICAAAGLVVDSIFTSQEVLGIRTEETEFAIKHVETGTYLQNPSMEGEQLYLDNDLVNTFVLSDNNDNTNTDTKKKEKVKNGNIYIQSEKYFNGEYMTISLDKKDHKPVWSDSEHSSPMYFKLKDDSSNEFAISFGDHPYYLGLAEGSNKVEITYEPDWFVIEANVDPITTEKEYIQNYNEINAQSKSYIKDLKLNEEGNPIGLFSTLNEKWVNTYQEIEKDAFYKINFEEKEYYTPFVDVVEGMFDEAIRLEDSSDTNMYIKTNTEGNMSFASYQTLPTTKTLDWMSSIPEDMFIENSNYPVSIEEKGIFRDDFWKTEYPVLTLDDDSNEVLLKQDLSDEELNSSIFWLIPNPNNLTQYAIYFPNLGGFLSILEDKLSIVTSYEGTDVEGENVSMSYDIENMTVEAYASLEYFRIDHSPYRNPEHHSDVSDGSESGKGLLDGDERDTISVKTPGLIAPGRAKIKIGESDPEELAGYWFAGFDYSWLNASADQMGLDNNAAIEAYVALNPWDFSSLVYDKGVAKNKKETSKLVVRDLKASTTYQGFLLTLRQDDGGVGKHITIDYVSPFTTKHGFKKPNWNVDIPWGQIPWGQIPWGQLPDIPWGKIPWGDLFPDIDFPGIGDLLPDFPELNNIDPGDLGNLDEILAEGDNKLDDLTGIIKGIISGLLPDLDIDAIDDDALEDVIEEIIIDDYNDKNPEYPLTPGELADSTETTTVIWDSTDESASSEGIPADEILVSAEDSIEVSVNFTQGTELGQTTDLKLNYEAEDTGNFGYVILADEPQDGETYTVVLSDLKHDSKYHFWVSYTNIFGVEVDQYEDDEIKTGYGNYEMYASTQREPIEVESTEINFEDSVGLTIATDVYNDSIIESDKIRVIIEDVDNSNEKIMDTNWISFSEWGSFTSADMPDAKFETANAGETTSYIVSIPGLNPFTEGGYNVHVWGKMDGYQEGWGIDSSGDTLEDFEMEEFSQSITSLTEETSNLGIVDLAEESNVVLNETKAFTSTKNTNKTNINSINGVFIEGERR